jgi:TRAP transporter 4TM/12TM fusion protein
MKNKALIVLGVAISVFHLYKVFAGIFDPYLDRSLHLVMFLVLAFMIDFFDEKRSKLGRTVDALCILIAVSSYIYVLMESDRLLTRFYWADPVTSLDIFFGISVIILVLEVCRRRIGLVLPILVSVFLLYAYFGNYMPGLLRHKGFAVSTIVDQMFLTVNGLYGTAIAVSLRYIVIFIIFGAFLKISGASDILHNFSMSLVGHTRGGPAKIAVLSSALFGTISGASTANVVATGSFTIPMMKKQGYTPHFAAAVECVASVGGSIMPPIMGTSSFLMAEITGIPYIEVATRAAIPAIIYYTSIFLMVHLEAVKTGLVGLSREKLPPLRESIKYMPLFFTPLVVMVYILARGMTPATAGLCGIAVLVAINLIYPKYRMNYKMVIDALAQAAKSSITLVTVCAASGLIVGSIALTGLGGKFTGFALSLSGGYLLPTLVIIAIATIIVGCGMPIASSYILLISLAGPALMALGVPIYPAHLFIIYFALFSFITPPVALGAYITAAMAETHYMKIGVTAFRLGLIAFIVPFFFIYQPALVGYGTVSEIALAAVSGLIGAFCMGMGLQGWMYQKTSVIERIMLICAGLALIYPGFYTDLLGIVLGVLVFVSQRRKKSLAVS